MTEWRQTRVTGRPSSTRSDGRPRWLVISPGRCPRAIRPSASTIPPEFVICICTAPPPLTTPPGELMTSPPPMSAPPVRWIAPLLLMLSG